MKLFFYNTMKKDIQEFIPISEDEVRMYTCGPTVYNYAHIGNLRTYIFEDVLRRSLEYAGYTIKHVMNITDVGHLTDDNDEGEDKMLKSSRETGRTVWEIARFYTDAFFHDTDRLNIIRPTVSCKATEHIDTMIDLVKRLENRGYTYQTGGNVYFSIDEFPEYGKLAGQKLSDLKEG
ncbi:MAG: cysteine--tRNA ligase, partial [Spirochaetia bacterium]|nr:cysteine--tRNA ligase [Spirochaetia bacterium]